MGKIGLMWFENDPKKPLEIIVKEIYEYNKNKYHKDGNVCYVNPKVLPSEEVIVLDNVKIKPWKSILPYHYWMTVE